MGFLPEHLCYMKIVIKYWKQKQFLTMQEVSLSEPHRLVCFSGRTQRKLKRLGEEFNVTNTVSPNNSTMKMERLPFVRKQV